MPSVTVTATYNHFPCQFTTEAADVLALLAFLNQLPAHGIHPPTAADVHPLLPLAPGEHRALVTKIKRDGDLIRFWFRGCKFESAKIFDLTDLATVGIDYRDLPDKVETPVRFLAVYTLSDKLNQKDNPYKDVVRLERAEGYDIRTDPVGNVTAIHSASGCDTTNGVPPTSAPTSTTTPPEEPPTEDGTDATEPALDVQKAISWAVGLGAFVTRDEAQRALDKIKTQYPTTVRASWIAHCQSLIGVTQ